uniref:Uncharacterized protein n=1 Tax=Arundo donax TaxID=35708 RepID=A0A0A9GWK1_ARUDO
MSTSSSVACSSCVAAFRSSVRAASDARRMCAVRSSANRNLAVTTRPEHLSTGRLATTASRSSFCSTSDDTGADASRRRIDLDSPGMLPLAYDTRQLSLASVLTSSRAAMAAITRLYMCRPSTARSSNQDRDAADEHAATASTQRATMPSSSASGSSSSQDLSALVASPGYRSTVCSR